MVETNKNVEKLSQQTKKQRQEFESMQRQIKSKPGQAKEEEFEDELDDQMAQSLFAEADEMGIFQAAPNDGVDYAKALQQIEKHIRDSKAKDSSQIDSKKEVEPRPEEATEQDPEDFSADNDELYNLAIDDQGNAISSETEQKSTQSKKMSRYEQEYNDAIQQMSSICRSLVRNNNASNADRKAKIDEKQITELCSTIWALSVELDYASKEDKEKCYLQTLLKGSFSLLGVKIPSCSLKLSACNI